MKRFFKSSNPYLVDAVFLAPEQRLREHLPRLLHVELSRPQEAEEDGVGGNLENEDRLQYF